MSNWFLQENVSNFYQINMVKFIEISWNIYQISDADELFLWYGWPKKGVYPYFQLGPLSEILTIANMRHAASRIWTCTEPEFRLSLMKLCKNDNNYTTAQQCCSNLSNKIWQILKQEVGDDLKVCVLNPYVSTLSRLMTISLVIVEI